MLSGLSEALLSWYVLFRLTSLRSRSWAERVAGTRHRRAAPEERCQRRTPKQGHHMAKWLLGQGFEGTPCSEERHSIA